MYDELIKRLREATGWKNASEHYSLMKQAADAIEELSNRVPKTPHGRLIDGDVAEVISFNEEEADGKDFMDGILHAADWISKQPTIIPAEEGE